ncbi:alpha/beta hydrolase-fold protein [Desertivirga brevis]|uniref:carboxylesterase family protein n=1 Tax=Desertivirga brevis TaxID=2810310 RepID=UPI001F611228|nr:alpha/beta hydrolase-fold protein [Pedobacter sp. SYSU D00873]
MIHTAKYTLKSGAQKLKNVFGLSIPLSLLLFSAATAQQNYNFTTGLVAPSVHRYGREALYKDFFALNYYKGSIKAPLENANLLTNDKGENISWRSLAVNTDKKFKDKALSNGYLYLTYQSDKEQKAILHVSGNNMVYVNGEPRAGDLYAYGYLYLPVQLKKGLNEFYVRGSSFSSEEGIAAELLFDQKSTFLNIKDPTLPIIIAGRDKNQLSGAVVIVNNTDKTLSGLKISSKLEGKTANLNVPSIPAMSVRKVPFNIDPSAISAKGMYDCSLSLVKGSSTLDVQNIRIEAVSETEDYSRTFVSNVDGSTQYFSVSPQKQGGKATPDLFLSVHGAGVEAINQARAYKSKEEGVLVAATNRRPRGFNWEDWGRIDALEVLGIAKKEFKPDPKRIYLTGHSMGGHGTWYLGATYPGMWAAIAPCAGYPTLAGYGSADGKIPDISGKPAVEKLILQASNQSDVFQLAKNYKAGGVYVHHGDSDEVVTVNFARQMHQVLAGFQKDMSYYEYPGGSHWFGDESVDWAPLFDYFKWHTIPADTAVKDVDFTTANPAISSSFHWVSILQQQESLKYSRIRLSRSDDLKTISGTTENASVVSFDLSGLSAGTPVKIALDGSEIKYSTKSGSDKVFLRRNNSQWTIGNALSDSEKGTLRNGTIKEAFNNRMVFVYGTSGSAAEKAWAYNKARYDAESWYYRGNGSVDVIADKEFSPARYADRGVIIYGNASTNSAYNKLLKNCPVKVDKGVVTAGNQKYRGDDLAAYFVWPRSDSKKASVAVIGGSGLLGMKAADANQYFAGGSGFADYMIFKADLLEKGASAIKQAGYYGNDWSLEKGQKISQD